MARLSESDHYRLGRLLETAEKTFFKTRSKVYDRDLSFLVLETVVPTFGSDIEAYQLQLARFSQTHAERIGNILGRYASDSAPLLLSQPEAVVLFERFEHAPKALRREWAAHLPMDLLEDVEVAWDLEVS
jgi:hypothetical protein